ncbi:hypothetical protein QFZ57_004328 [Arthrobacter sp. B1I2]|nr:hypothetical protein [Arthrobacter sp. B1I2]
MNARLTALGILLLWAMIVGTFVILGASFMHFVGQAVSFIGGAL